MHDGHVQGESKLTTAGVGENHTTKVLKSLQLTTRTLSALSSSDSPDIPHTLSQWSHESARNRG